jgi:flap endonuclease-1
MPAEIRDALDGVDVVNDVRRIFLRPDVTDAFAVAPGEPDFDGVLRFLCDEREFSRERVAAALDRACRGRTLF